MSEIFSTSKAKVLDRRWNPVMFKTGAIFLGHSIFFKVCMKFASSNVKWVNIFKNRPSKVCGWQPLKNLK